MFRWSNNMNKIDQRGTAAFEFTLCAIPFFFLVFAVFDIGRYAITIQSLQSLADGKARAAKICTKSTSPRPHHGPTPAREVR
jgi:Flp pilus assembly protein TadG